MGLWMEDFLQEGNQAGDKSWAAEDLEHNGKES
jgi:hypothetical protein